MPEQSHSLRPRITKDEILSNFDLILIDAYGVLVRSEGALPGAAEFIAELNELKKPYYIVTNDVSRLPDRCALFYAQCGLLIPESRVLTAGLAIKPSFERHGLVEPVCLTLGTVDTHAYVKRAGGVSAGPAEFGRLADFDAVIIGDDSGFDFLPTLNETLNLIHRKILSGSLPRLLLANPDLLYPKAQNAFGFTSGAIARLLELGIEHLHPGLNLRFEVLGKPSPTLFEMALTMTGIPKARTLMLGDQLHTDICGANRCEIATVLLLTGVTTPFATAHMGELYTPTYVLNSLRFS